jgi:multimeric flavodoxin WrbA
MEVLMTKVVSINASPRLDQGHTGLILEPFLEGLKEKGAAVDLFYASELNVKPCSCGQLSCWYKTPGECICRDSMTTL